MPEWVIAIVVAVATLLGTVVGLVGVARVQRSAFRFELKVGRAQRELERREELYQRLQRWVFSVRRIYVVRGGRVAQTEWDQVVLEATELGADVKLWGAREVAEALKTYMKDGYDAAAAGVESLFPLASRERANKFAAILDGPEGVLLKALQHDLERCRAELELLANGK
jgi:hypothetical protein